MGEDKRLVLAQRKYSDLSPIYARLARSIAEGLVRLRGMSPEEAEVVGVQMALDQFRDLLVGMEEMDEAAKETIRLLWNGEG